MNRNGALALSLALILAACTPTATIQTTAGNVSIPVLMGVPYTLTAKLPFESLTSETPDHTAVTFQNCQGGAVTAQNIRKYGADLALAACQKAVQRKVDIENAQNTLSLILLPVAAVIGYFMFKFFGCLFSFGANCPSSP